MLCPGDIVNFYLYVDDKGLGAEMCCVEQKATSRFNTLRVCLPTPAMHEPVDVDNVAAVFSRLYKVFLDDEDEDGDDEEYDLGKSWKVKRAPSLDGSTCGGTTSDSEGAASSGEDSDSEMESSEVLAALTSRVPLGVLVPRDFCPPPGLSL